MGDLESLSTERSLVAVVFEPLSLEMPWAEALRGILERAPAALPIVCQRFSATVPWPEMAQAGAFHAVTLPLDIRELRQSLGFVWAKRQRSRKVIRLPRRAAPLRRTKLVAYGYGFRGESSAVPAQCAEQH
jgi:DNA-binding NtrC family response regulator